MPFIIVISMRVESRTINNNYMLDHSNESQRTAKKKNGMKMRKTTPTFTAYYVITTFGTVFSGPRMKYWRADAAWYRTETYSPIFFSSLFLLVARNMHFLIRLNGIRLKQQTGQGKKLINELPSPFLCWQLHLPNGSCASCKWRVQNRTLSQSAGFSASAWGFEIDGEKMHVDS